MVSLNIESNDRIQFGIAAPQIHRDLPVDPAEIQAYIQRAEALGFHSLWVQEQAGLRQAASALEPVSLLSYAAALTRRIRIGAAVFLINLRNPIQLAKSLATLDQLSHGRLIVGVGLGAVTRLYQAYGLSPERRVARFVEALTVIRRLWTEDDVTFEGQFWQLKKATLVPKPFQKSCPPVWFGANEAPALKRAVKYGDGFIGAGSSSIEDFRNQVKIVIGALEEQKKDPEDFSIAKRIYIAVDRNPEKAAKVTREWFGLYYGRSEMADRVAVWGRVEECARQLREVIAAGARLLVLNPMFNMREQLEILAADVIPKIHP
jgi:probable F420-dependent oxidoreductase